MHADEQVVFLSSLVASCDDHKHLRLRAPQSRSSQVVVCIDASAIVASVGAGVVGAVGALTDRYDGKGLG